MLLDNLNSFRREDKFITNLKKANSIKSQIKKFFILDKNSKKVGGYYNFSVYFDTLNLKFYREKKEGLRDRIKIRLRCHLENLTKKPDFWFLELKSRFDGTSQKKRYKLSSEEAYQIISGNFDFSKNPYLSKSLISFLFAKHYLRPVVSVCYYREAYLSNIFPTTRLTFDTQIISSQNFIPMNYFINKHYIIDQKQVLIETKYYRYLPEILKKIFAVNNLSKITFSKYSNCLEKSLIL